MSTNVGDLVQIVDIQTLLGQTLMNVWYYRCTVAVDDGVETLEQLASFLRLSVLDEITAIQVTGLLHTQRQVKNLTNGIDFFVDATVDPGQVSTSGTDALPSFISAGFMLVRSSLATRNGYKRFGGLPESMVAGNASAIPTGLVDNIESAIVQTPVLLNAAEFEPVIVKRPIPEPGGGDYVYSTVSACQFRGIGTQNTRKPGRGI